MLVSVLYGLPDEDELDESGLLDEPLLPDDEPLEHEELLPGDELPPDEPLLPG